MSTSLPSSPAWILGGPALRLSFLPRVLRKVEFGAQWEQGWGTGTSSGHGLLTPAHRLRPLCGGHCSEPARDALLWAPGGFLPKAKVTFGKEVSRARRLRAPSLPSALLASPCPPGGPGMAGAPGASAVGNPGRLARACTGLNGARGVGTHPRRFCSTGKESARRWPGPPRSRSPTGGSRSSCPTSPAPGSPRGAAGG